MSSARASANASSPHGYQSTGFSACCSRYGDVSEARRFGILDTFLPMSHSRETVTADPGPPAAGPYSHAVKSNGLLFCLGSGAPRSGHRPARRRHARREGQALPGEPTIIAEAAGAKLENAVRIAVYVTDISVFAEMNEAYASYFQSDPPARTTIGVAALPMGAEVEMDAVIAL